MRTKALRLSLLVLLCAPGCDRPLTFDASGIAHGTGEKVYRYKTGAPQIREAYVDGKAVRSRWFRPDGTLIKETKWVDGTGEGIYLREDGSVRRRMSYVNGVAEGPSAEYDEGGRVIKVTRFHAGQPVIADVPVATRPAM